VLRAALLAEPPAELQVRLKELALAAASRPQPVWRLAWARAWLAHLSPAFTVGAVQAIAVILLGAALWLGWQAIVLVAPLLGDVGLAFALVASSPLTAYLPALQAALQQLVGLAAVAMLAWVALDAVVFRPSLPELGA
ncbi:MAG: hypothetical protein KGJ86_19465, partial [Chloroflexota bacterium]|nr:hypothetical protein [Chloroflexota bacterium]